jgi:hypothetical protein
MIHYNHTNTEEYQVENDRSVDDGSRLTVGPRVVAVLMSALARAYEAYDERLPRGVPPDEAQTGRCWLAGQQGAVTSRKKNNRPCVGVVRRAPNRSKNTNAANQHKR